MCDSESNLDSRLFELNLDSDSNPKKHELGFGFQKKSDGFEAGFEFRFESLGTDYELCHVIVIRDGLDSNLDLYSDQLDSDSSQKG